MQNIIHVEATNLPDLWYQTLYKAIEFGRDFVVDSGSYAGQKRKEFDFVVLHSKCPGIGELLPKLNPALNLDNPVADNYLDSYLPYLMTGEEQPGEQYTYGQRIINDGCNQMDIAIDRYKTQGHRNNQLIMQIGKPSDMLLKDPPCLRHIDTRIQDGKLHFYPYFRSWDLWGGLPANLAAIELMKQHMAMEIGVENGEIIATSKGCHIYSYIFEIAETVRGCSSDEFKEMMKG